MADAVVATSPPDDLPSALRAVRSEAQSAFGDAAVYLEQKQPGPGDRFAESVGRAHAASTTNLCNDTFPDA